jgi:hypothetical protein
VDAIQERYHDSGLGEADTEDGGAELEGDGCFLFGIVPDNELDEVEMSPCFEDVCSGIQRGFVRTLFWGNFGFRPPPTIAR